jgi:hypothetical protein
MSQSLLTISSHSKTIRCSCLYFIWLLSLHCEANQSVYNSSLNYFNISHGKNCHWVKDSQYVLDKTKNISAYATSSEPLQASQSYSVTCDENNGFLSFNESIESLKLLAYGKNIPKFNITMIGDSTMTYQFRHLCAFLDSDTVKEVDSADQFCTPYGTWHPIEYYCDVGENIRIHRVMWGQKLWYDTHTTLDKYLVKYLTDFTKSDIILMNYGLHQDTEAELFDPVGGISMLVKKAKDVYNTQKRIYGDRMPLVIWREATPQHFQSTNGWHYLEWCSFDGKDSLGQPCSCVPRLTNDMLEGHAKPLGNTPKYEHKEGCLPTCSSATTRNSLAYAEIINSDFRYERMFDAFIDTPFNVHFDNNNIDCSHINAMGINLQNQIFISDIVKRFKQLHLLR